MILFVPLALLAAALAVGLCVAVLAGLAAATAAAIVSTSVLVAWLQKRPSAFFRTLFTMTGSVLGIPFGVGAFWLEAWIMKVDLAWYWIVAGGAAAGWVGGAGCGWLACSLLLRILDRAARRLERK